MAGSPVKFAVAEAQEIARALAAVAASDGAILAREAMFLDGFAVSYGVGGHRWIPEPLDEQRLKSVVVGADKRLEVVRLCLSMAMSDQEFAEQERFTIERIARALDIPDVELEQLIAERRKP